MECEFFMGPLGKGSWHEWQHQHLVSLLGMVWYNLARSESSNTTWAQFKTLVEARFGIVWKRKFVRPAETRWMVIWEGAAAVEERWDEVDWIFSEWAPRKLLGTPFCQYWARSMVMLKNPMIRLHAKFASSLGEVVLFWAYHWLRGDGGYFLKRDGKKAERLPPGMRFAEAADFLLEVEGRLEECRSKPDRYFGEVLDWAKKNLDEDSLAHFMQNFEEDCSSGFFGEMTARLKKWGDRHQRLPLSMARLPCHSFYVGKWQGSAVAWERAVGQEFARALLLELWPGQYDDEEWASWEGSRGFREIVKTDLAEASTAGEKDKLTLGLYSKACEDEAFRCELVRYAASAVGENVIECDDDENNPSGVSSFTPIWTFPLLYEWACHLIFFVPIHQQLVESLFSMYDQKSRQFDRREIDIVRIGQYRSASSRAIIRDAATPREIREAGQMAINKSRALHQESIAQTPHAEKQRKRDHNLPVFL
ncbi:unnamed protein product, partial [Hapterophycus canaliculatus]